MTSLLGFGVILYIFYFYIFYTCSSQKKKLDGRYEILTNHSDSTTSLEVHRIYIRAVDGGGAERIIDPGALPSPRKYYSHAYNKTDPLAHLARFSTNSLTH
jgi:hypothetical protein